MMGDNHTAVRTRGHMTPIPTVAALGRSGVSDTGHPPGSKCRVADSPRDRAVDMANDHQTIEESALDLIQVTGLRKGAGGMAKTAMTGLSVDRMRELARAGAEVTLKRLRAEIIAIERAFPELALPRRRRAVRKAVKQATNRTRHMSAAARKAVSERMKRYCTKPLRGSYSTHQFVVAA